jgi:sporulation protein YlmC with PRC-barrel domain
VSRFSPIGAMIAVVAFAALPALADQAAQTPAAPPASESSEAPPQPSAPPSSQPASQPTGVVATTNNPNLAVATIKLESGVRAGKIIGEAVQNDQNQRVGTVDDLILSPESKVTMAIVSVGGFLGMGSKLVAVPWQQLTTAGDHLVLPGATKASLNAAPTFQY